MNLIFTHHVLYDSCYRIQEDIDKQNKDEVRKFLTERFFNFYQWMYRGERTKFKLQKDWVIEMKNKRETFVYIEYWDTIKVITYIVKNDIDILEYTLLKICRWVKKNK